jgi:hypothetical protein
MSLLLHELLDQLPTSLKLLHNLPVLLPHLVFFIRLPVELIINMSLLLILLLLESVLELLIKVGLLLLLLLQVLEKVVLVLHPLLETPLAQVHTLTHYLIVVLLDLSQLFLEELSLVLVASLQALRQDLCYLLASLYLLGYLLPLELFYLLPSDFVIGLSLEEVFTFLLLNVSPSLLELLLLLLNLPQALGHLLCSLPGQMLLNLLNLFITHFLVVLHTLLLFHVEEFFGCLESFFGFLVEVLIFQPAVEVIEDFELDCSELFHSEALSLALFQVNQVHKLSVTILNLGQEGEAACCRFVELGMGTINR